LAAPEFSVACVCLLLSFTASAQNRAQPVAKSSETPTAEQILNRFVQAEGGRTAFAKLTSRVMKGTISVPSMSLTGTVEVHERAPNRSLAIITINGGSFRQGFDGTTGWTDDPQNGLREQTGAELAEARRESDFYHTLHLQKLYSSFTLTGKEKIGDRDVYVIEAAVPEGGSPEKMYFDSGNGLLVRDTSQHYGPDGVSDFQQDYEDYRQVDGIQLPHTIRQTNEGTLVIITVAEYHHNVQLDEGEFAKPAAQ
jgi:hypothetical protein